MIKEVSSDPGQSFIRRGLEAVTRPAKVLGVTALSGLAGYAASKGIETFIMPTEPNEVYYEVAVAGGVALLGGFVASETIDH